MRKIFLAACLPLLCAGMATGQTTKAHKLGVDETAPQGLPATVVRVYVTVEKQSTLPGPYARYAQKYIGSVAPMNPRDTYTIRNVWMDYSDPDRQAMSTGIYAMRPGGEAEHLNHAFTEGEFSKSSPDRMSLADRGGEDMAREAANLIYTLRKRRYDLISGEAGENVYGAGLKAAIDEMTRLENEYLSLFLGKQVTTITTHEYDVFPEQGKNNYIVCRFSAETGIQPSTDLSAEPVLMLVTPRASAPAMAAKGDKKGSVAYRVANMSQCRVMFGTDELADAIIPIYQLGTTVTGR